MMESLPDGLSPKTNEVLQQTWQDRVELLESVRGLTDAQTDYRPDSDAWSIGEVLHHLALAHEATAKLMSVLLRRAKEDNIPRDPNPDGSALHALDDVVARRGNAKVSAPERVMPKSYAPANESLSRLEASRTRLVDTVAKLSTFDLSQLTFTHPFFGELDACEWLLVAGWHERRHTGQIARIIASTGYPTK